MFRKFLQFLLRVTDKPTKQDPEMTDKINHLRNIESLILGGASKPHNSIKTESVNIEGEITIEKMRAIVDVFHNSNVINAIIQLDNLLNKRNHVFTDVEQQLMDQFIESYNLKHKSPLAQAMSETGTK